MKFKLAEGLNQPQVFREAAPQYCVIAAGAPSAYR